MGTNTASRPRLSHATDKLLNDIKEELEYIHEETSKDVSDYMGERGVKKDKIIRKALEALQEGEY